MKTILYLLLAGLLCMGITGCEGDSDDSPATITTVTTNAVTGVVQTNVVVVEDAVADVAAEPADDEVVGLGAPAVANTVTGRWIGGYSGSGVNALMSLTLVQEGDAVSGTYAFSDAGSGEIFSGTLNGSTLALGVYRDGIICSITGQFDFDASTYMGTWEDKAGNSGTFSLR